MGVGRRVMAEGRSERSWVWYSTVESVGEGKLSILAIIETVGAISFSVWFLIHGFTLHLLFSACKVQNISAVSK